MCFRTSMVSCFSILARQNLFKKKMKQVAGSFKEKDGLPRDYSPPPPPHSANSCRFLVVMGSTRETQTVPKCGAAE